MLFGKRKQLVKHILVVEDEPLTAFDNETMIQAAGYTVVATVDRVAEAEARLAEGGIDLILSDVRLSGKRDGADLARVARRLGVPILFATGLAPDNAAELAIGVLLKPYNDRVLKAALKAVDEHLQGRPVKPPSGLTLFPLTP